MKAFTLKLYMTTLKSLLKEPGFFFKTYENNSNPTNPIYFLTASCIISTLIFLYSTSFSSPLVSGALYFINAFGMTFTASIITTLILSIALKRIIKFQKCFSIFAFSTGITIIGAGIPFLLWFAETWKWGLVATGIKNSFRLSNLSVFLVLITSIVSIYFTFYFLFFCSVLLKNSLI